MHWLVDIFTSPDFLKIAFPALAAIVAWYFNERSKPLWEQFKRKEESYRELLRCLRGFYVTTQDKQLKEQFLHQVNLCWLYAPDAVITAAYRFLGTVHTGVKFSDEEKEKACGELVLAIRQDLLTRRVVTRTELTASDFQRLIATDIRT